MEPLFSRGKLKKFIAGGIAGAVAKTSIAPLDRIKVLFQTTTRAFSISTAWNEVLRILSEEGICAFWKGNLVQMLRIIPYTAIVISN